MTHPSNTPAVMGRSAVLVVATILGTVGIGQLAGLKVSGVIDESPDHYLGTVWGCAFVLGAVLVGTAWRTSDAYLAMVFEIAGIVCAVGGVAIYVLTLFNSADGWPWNGTVTIALCVALTINLAGRGVLLIRSIIRWLLAFHPGGRVARAVVRWQKAHQ